MLVRFTAVQSIPYFKLTILYEGEYIIRLFQRVKKLCLFSRNTKERTIQKYANYNLILFFSEHVLWRTCSALTLASFFIMYSSHLPLATAGKRHILGLVTILSELWIDLFLFCIYLHLHDTLTHFTKKTP